VTPPVIAAMTMTSTTIHSNGVIRHPPSVGCA
jgi:hypothetical protein